MTGVEIKLCHLNITALSEWGVLEEQLMGICVNEFILGSGPCIYGPSLKWP